MAAENNNRAIVLNTIILYARLAITAICGLLTTRFALQALGVVDFGLFSVVGGVISFIAIFNTVMLSTSNRFIAAAIGKHDNALVNKTFNANLIIHCSIAVLTLLVALPVGDWYIRHYVNFSGDIEKAVQVFDITIIGSVLSFVGVPYNGLLMAKERFLVFCSTDVISSVLKMIGAWLLIGHFSDKLLVYALLITVLTAYPTFVFWTYCRAKFPELTKFRFVSDKVHYKEVFSFSVWVGYGALATIGKGQGSALIVNAFFNTIMNTALGLANSVNAIVHMVASNLCKSIAPQIVKTYSSGNMARCEYLVVLSSKMSFLIMFMVASPFFVEPEWILGLWLGDIPPYTITFVQLLLVDALVGSLNAGIPEVVFATGNIKGYQIVTNTLFLSSVAVAWYVLSLGQPAYVMIVVFIVFSLIVLVVRQLALNYIVHFNNWRLVRESYLPSLTLVVLSSPLILIHTNPLVHICIVLAVLFVIAYFVDLNTGERKYIVGYVKRLMH